MINLNDSDAEIYSEFKFLAITAVNRTIQVLTLSTE